MNDGADISGVFQRPSLIDYLVVAESQQLDIGLNVYVGRLEVGLVGLCNGRPVYADMPGATGNTALSLLTRLSNARVMANRWTARLTNVEGSWRELLSERERESSQSIDRAQRLAQVRAELRELETDRCDDSGIYDLVALNNSAADVLARRVAAEFLDWGVIEAYLHGNYDHARQIASAREQLQPGDVLAAANLERLRLRLLEDEFVAGVAEVRG